MSRCRKDCPYEALYTSSQRSLEHLARSKEAAVARATTLRTGIFAALRQHYPRAYADAARKAPDGLNAVPDEVVLAYLNGFLGASPENVASRTGAAAAGMSALRAALTAAGYTLPPGDDPGTWAGAIAAAGTPAPSTPHPPTPDIPAAPLDDLFIDEPAPEDPYPYGDTEDDPYGDPYAPSAAPAAPAGGTAPDNLDDLFGPSTADTAHTPAPEPAHTPAPEPAHTATPTPPPAAEPPAPPARTGTAKVQPTLLPGTGPTPKNTRRGKRAAAETMATPSATAGPPPDETIANSLLAAVSAARPAFISTLTRGGTVDASTVSAWASAEATSEQPRIRIVGAKDHHRSRGDLIVPHTPLYASLGQAYADSVWGRCISGLRGARLYEAGVVLASYPSGRTLDFDRSVTILTCDDNTHLLGFVLVAGADLPAGSAIRTATAAAVEKLLDKRLHKLVVVTASAAKRGPSDIAEAIAAEAETRNWAVTAPILTARSADLGSRAAAMVAAVG